MAKLKCAECGRPIENAYYLNGKAYGYNCYKQKLAIIYKQWEDEKNAEGQEGISGTRCFGRSWRLPQDAVYALNFI